MKQGGLETGGDLQAGRDWRRREKKGSGKALTEKTGNGWSKNSQMVVDDEDGEIQNTQISKRKEKRDGFKNWRCQERW